MELLVIIVLLLLASKICMILILPLLLSVFEHVLGLPLILIYFKVFVELAKYFFFLLFLYIIEDGLDLVGAVTISSFFFVRGRLGRLSSVLHYRFLALLCKLRSDRVYLLVFLFPVLGGDDADAVDTFGGEVAIFEETNCEFLIINKVLVEIVIIIVA